MWLLFRIFTNVFPIIWRFITTVSEHFTDTLRTKQYSWRLIRQNDNSLREIRKYFKIVYGWYRFLFDYRADRFQVVRYCSIVSIINNRENIRRSGMWLKWHMTSKLVIRESDFTNDELRGHYPTLKLQPAIFLCLNAQWFALTNYQPRQCNASYNRPFISSTHWIRSAITCTYYAFTCNLFEKHTWMLFYAWVLSNWYVIIYNKQLLSHDNHGKTLYMKSYCRTVHNHWVIYVSK